MKTRLLSGGNLPKSSFRFGSSLRGIYLWQNMFSGNCGHVQFEKMCSSKKKYMKSFGFPTFSEKWLSRPNHYAHEMRSKIQILCRTPVSILKYLSPRPQNLRIASRHEHQIDETARIPYPAFTQMCKVCGDLGRPKLLSPGQSLCRSHMTYMDACPP